MKDTIHDAAATAIAILIATQAHGLQLAPLEPNEERYGPCLAGTTVKDFGDGSKIVKWRKLPCHQHTPTLLSETAAGKNLQQATAADVASTVAAIAMLGATEANPIGLVGVLGVKLAMLIHQADAQATAANQKGANQAAAIQWGASANNACLFVPAAAAACPLLGVGVSALSWPTKDKP